MKTTSEIIAETIKGLSYTAVEKICCLGPEDAEDDVAILLNVATDLTDFWDISTHWIETMKADIERAKEECPEKTAPPAGQ